MDLSVYFSGYNLGPVIELAVKSFRLMYPCEDVKIYYFDDNSTDGSPEVLRELGVEVFTWNPELYELYTKYLDTGTVSGGLDALIVRCDFIFKQILAHCKTSHLLIQDGDTVTLDSRFLEEYSESPDIHFVPKLLGEVGDLSMVRGNPLFDKYYRYVDTNSGSYKTFKIVHSRLNMGAINVRELLDNLWDVNHVKLLTGDLIDVGSDLYAQQCEMGTSYTFVNLDDRVHHWSWVSSSLQPEVRDSHIDYDIIKRISHSRNNKRLVEVMRLCDVDFRRIARHFKEVQRESINKINR